MLKKKSFQALFYALGKREFHDAGKFWQSAETEDIEVLDEYKEGQEESQWDEGTFEVLDYEEYIYE